MATMDVTEASFEKEVLQSEIPVVVDFWAEWCGPCRMFGPIFEETSKDYEGRVKFVKIDADANGAILTQFGVRGIPTSIIFKDGSAVNTMVGSLSKQELSAKIDEVLSA